MWPCASSLPLHKFIFILVPLSAALLPSYVWATQRDRCQSPSTYYSVMHTERRLSLLPKHLFWMSAHPHTLLSFSPSPTGICLCWYPLKHCHLRVPFSDSSKAFTFSSSNSQDLFCAICVCIYTSISAQAPPPSKLSKNQTQETLIPSFRHIHSYSTELTNGNPDNCSQGCLDTLNSTL